MKAFLEPHREPPPDARESLEAGVAAVRQGDPLAAYPVLAPLLRPGMRILEIGCGTGWLSNALAHHHGAAVSAIDLDAVAVERARAVAAAMGLATRFEVADLFGWEPPAPFDLVLSLGVLHHTHDCAAGLARACGFVRPGGHAFVGLYHLHGRRPLLEHFRAMAARGAGEAGMLERDRGTQHTLAEMLPVLEACGMRLESTSINGFGPVEPRPELLARERELEEVGRRRLAADEYDPGFFVFLASRSTALDTKPYVGHDPTIGYRYLPGTRMELPRPGGGRYRIAVNSRGVRSDREYGCAKPAGAVRIVVLGDSMAAGQFVSNDLRFSEQLERSVPGLEVVNLALEGSGTDQQVLIYEHEGLRYEHDAVLLLPFLQNIRRNLVEAREAFAPGTGARVLRGKPRFELVDGRLELRNVPVPEHVAASGPATTDADAGAAARLKSAVSRLPGIDAVKRVAYALFPWEPFPEYRDPGDPAWRLMAALIARLRALAAPRPVVVAPVFYSSYVRMNMARNYRDRYAELARAAGIQVVDLLPHFRREGVGERAFQEPHDMHFSAYGHWVLARALEAELGRLGLLPGRAP